MNASSDAFLLEQTASWLEDHLTVIPQPFLGYYHFLPPHAPYRTSLEFYGRFASDGLSPVNKPLDEFGSKPAVQAALEARTEYDEFILYADKAFGSMYDALERSGLLDHTWLVVTSDHGEMFERGLIGHGNPTLYQPVIRVPLLIFEPGREVGMDVHAVTSAVDVLPTLAQVTGHTIPDWTRRHGPAAVLECGTGPGSRRVCGAGQKEPPVLAADAGHDHVGQGALQSDLLLWVCRA